MRAGGSLCLILAGFDALAKSGCILLEKGKASRLPEMLSFDLTFSLMLQRRSFVLSQRYADACITSSTICKLVLIIGG
jgi:hypothetical protein